MTPTPTRGFKSKTITKICTGKMLAWTRSITDERVRQLAQDNTIITGGAIVSMLLGEEVNDFDIYLRTPEAAYALAEYYVAKLKENPPAAFKGDAKHTVDVSALLEPAIQAGFKAKRLPYGTEMEGPLPARVRIVVKSAGVASGTTQQKDYQYFEGIRDAASQAAATEHYVDEALGRADGEVTDPTEPEFEAPAHAPGWTTNTAALDDEAAAKVTDPKADKDAAKRGKYHVRFVTSNAITLSDGVQVVLRFQGDPAVIHESFDFVHCVSHWTSWDKKLTLNPDAMECILAKELRYIGSKYPLCSVIRLRKFISRGWTVNAGQILKMLFQIAAMDLTNTEVLEDQLVGVDSAYFTQLIDKLREQPDPAHVDGTYLATLIDRIF